MIMLSGYESSFITYDVFYFRGKCQKGKSIINTCIINLSIK